MFLFVCLTICKTSSIVFTYFLILVENLKTIVVLNYVYDVGHLRKVLGLKNKLFDGMDRKLFYSGNVEVIALSP